MKKRQFSKKLQLNKTTIANINESQMNDVKGGLTGKYCTGAEPYTKVVTDSDLILCCEPTYFNACY